jgi:hypothetical protein
VIGTRYLHALDAGDIPLTFLFSGTGWLRLSADALVALAVFRARHGLTGWDETMMKLLGGAS